MQKTHRNELDIETAFAAGAKRRDAATPQAAEIVLTESQDHHSIAAVETKSAEQATEQSSLAKRLLRPAARILYQFLKPAIRPFIFRWRAYMTAGVLSDEEQTRLLLKQEIASLKQDILEELLPRMERSSAAVFQDIRSTRIGLTEHLNILTEPLSILTERLNILEQYAYATARRVAINAGDGEVLLKTQVGYVLCATSDQAQLACLLDTGDLEPGTRRLIERFLRPGDIFVDVGANIGLHTIAAARALQGRGKVIAFEPFEPTKNLLEKSVSLNGFRDLVEIHQAAVARSRGNQTLFLGEVSGHHSLVAPQDTAGRPPNAVDVVTVRLDEVIEASQIVSLIKIDAEGAELDVLESARSIILNSPDIALIVEYGPSHLKRTGHETQDWLSAFTELGLVYRAIDEHTGNLQERTWKQLEDVASVNLFFSRPGSRSWAKAEGSV
jgi:FkbM family methyltransferase